MKQRAAVVRFIGAVKLLKAVVLACAAIGLLHSYELQSLFWHVLGYWNERALTTASILSGVYALIFLVEGIGLVAVRRWAEWMTLIVTTSFIPLEIIKLARRPTAPGVVTLALNVAVVVYLTARRLRDRPSLTHRREIAQFAG